jgi:hypothetical protein
LALHLHPNQCLIFFRDPEAMFSPSWVKQVLEDVGITTDGIGETFVVRWGDGPTLHVSIIHGKVATILAGRLMPSGSKHRAMAETSTAYIEIKFESLDEVLDEMNTLIQVQATLQNATKGLLYCSWNQSFSTLD